MPHAAVGAKKKKKINKICVDPRTKMRLGELGKLKKYTSSGLDPTTFRLVA
jgi:hypothetical protein